MTAFVDTFALLARLNPRDAAHGRVTAYLQDFAGRLVTDRKKMVAADPSERQNGGT